MFFFDKETTSIFNMTLDVLDMFAKTTCWVAWFSLRFYFCCYHGNFLVADNGDLNVYLVATPDRSKHRKDRTLGSQIFF